MTQLKKAYCTQYHRTFTSLADAPEQTTKNIIQRWHRAARQRPQSWVPGFG
jgi:hypothetical protein